MNKTFTLLCASALLLTGLETGAQTLLRAGRSDSNAAAVGNLLTDRAGLNPGRFGASQLPTGTVDNPFASAEQRLTLDLDNNIFHAPLKARARKVRAILKDDPSRKHYVGIYDISTERDEYTMWHSELQKWGKGAVNCGGTYYCMSYLVSGGNLFSYSLTRIEEATGKDVETSNVKSLISIYDADWDPEEKVAYGYFYHLCDLSGNTMTSAPQVYGWGKVDPETTQFTMIKEMDDATQHLSGVVRTDDDKWYAIGEDGTFYSVDAATGNLTTVKAANADIANKKWSGAAYDGGASRIIYPAYTGTVWNFWSVDVATGNATLLHPQSSKAEWAALTILSNGVEDKVPDVVTDAHLEFEQGALSGNVVFTMPDHLFDDTAAEGEATWSVALDGKEVATGTAAYGAVVKAPLTVDRNYRYNIDITVTNEAGTSPTVNLNEFIGNDVPQAPKSVTAAWADDNFTITWTAVAAEGVLHGAIDPDAVVYRVTNLADGTVKTTAAGATELVWPQATPKEYTIYQFAVSAVTEGGEGDATKSNMLGLGIVLPPYSNKIQTAADLSLLTTLKGADAGNKSTSAVYNWSIFNNWCRIGYTAQKDDYLILPPIRLGKGMYYTADFMAATYNATKAEDIELVLATGNTDADFKAGTVVGDFHITVPYNYPSYSLNTGGEHVSASFTAPEDGVYYLAIHAKTARNAGNYGFVRYFNLSAPVNPATPEGVTNLTATAEQSGMGRVSLRFNAPKLNVAGNVLSSLTRASIVRDGETVADVALTQKEMAWTDYTAEYGMHTYTVTAYNDHGSATPASAEAFVGLTVPATVSGLNMAESPLGTAMLTWPAVEADIYGKPINGTKYDIYDVLTEELIASDVADPAYTKTIANAGQQDWAYFAVKAKNDYGFAPDFAYTQMLPYGTPYALPYTESFAKANGILGVSSIGNAGRFGQFGFGTSETIKFKDGTPLLPYDNDNGYLFFYNSDYLTWGQGGKQIYTGKIAIPADAKNPTLGIATFGQGATCTNYVLIQARVVGTDNFVDVAKILTTAPNVWEYQKFDLSKFAGKEIQLYISMLSISHTFVMLDALKVFDMPDIDLTDVTITAPSSAIAGQSINTTVSLTNDAKNDLQGSAYTVDLLLDGEVAATIPGVDVAADATVTLPATITTSVLRSSARLQARVNCEADEDDTNNTSRVTRISLEAPTYPAVADLAAERADANVDLTWSAPAIDQSKTVTDDFESYAAGEQAAGEWTLIDEDQLATGGFQNADIQGLTIGKPLSWLTVNTATNDLNESFTAHSGNQYMMAVYANNGATNSDWLITPELSGEAQTITFWARSYSTDYLETFEVYTSTTGKAIADFTLMEKKAEISAEWTQYTFQVPAGVKYLAIRYCSTDCFAMFIDDVTMTLAPFRGEVLGYNIYCDGKKLNTEPLTATTYTHANVDNKAHSYLVTVVYNVGESTPSNEAQVEALAGIDAATTAGATISVDANTIVIGNADGLPVNVADVAGHTIYSGVGNAHIAVLPAVYVVRAGNTVTKVLVK